MQILSKITTFTTIVLLACSRTLYETYPPYGFTCLALSLISLLLMVTFRAKSFYKDPTEYFKENPNIGFFRVMLPFNTKEIIATLDDENQTKLNDALYKNKFYNPSFFIKEGQHTVNVRIVPKRVNKSIPDEKYIYTVDLYVQRGNVYNVTLNEKAGTARVGIVPKSSTKELKKYVELIEEVNK